MRNMSKTSIPTYIHSLLPSALHPFVSLSYPLSPSPTTKLRPLSTKRTLQHSFQQLYGQGPKDVYFVIFCALAFTLLREVCIRYIFSSIARGWMKRVRSKENRLRVKNGKKQRAMTKIEMRREEHTVLRFSEQGWSFLYCTIYWSLGAVSTGSRLRLSSWC